MDGGPVSATIQDGLVLYIAAVEALAGLETGDRI